MSEDTTGGSVVCGVDGSTGARDAIRVAARLASALDLRLVLAHAADTPPLTRITPIGVTYRPDAVEEIREAAIAAGARVLDEQVEGVGVGECERRVELGPAGPVLARLARDETAAMIVVGARERGGVAKAVLGSVSRDVLATADCPVLVVPGPA